MHTGKEPEAPRVQKRRASCNTDTPQVGCALSDGASVVKVNCRKMNRRKTSPYCTYRNISGYFSI